MDIKGYTFLFLAICLVTGSSQQAWADVPQAHGALVVVGQMGDSDCDFNSVQAAIDSGAAEIRVVNAVDRVENLLIDDRDVEIVGGYADCETALDGFPITGASVINGSGAVLPVITVFANGPQRQITLRNIVLRGGTADPGSFRPAGGISTAFANVRLTLHNADVFNNDGVLGGGIYIGGANSELILSGSVVRVNTAANGGGVYCESGARVVVRGGHSGNISLNNATGLSTDEGNGGGIYADDCEVELSSGNLPGTLGPGGINGNKAHRHGGGIYAVNGSVVTLNGHNPYDTFQTRPATLEGNRADADFAGGGEGGAIYATGAGTRIDAFGTLIEGNRSGFHGGGFYLQDGAHLNMHRLPAKCWDAFKCNYFLDNRASTNNGVGGAIYLRTGATATIAQTYFDDNRADEGTAIYASHNGTAVTLEGNMFWHNGNDGLDNYNDLHAVVSVGDAAITAGFNTFADNDLTSATLRADGALFHVFSSVIHDVGSGPVVDIANGANTVFDCIQTHDVSLTGSQIQIGNPAFLNLSTGDLHLLHLTSPAIDVCDTVAYTPVFNDIDNDPRGYNDPTHPNTLGPYDLGADETEENDVIFRNGLD